MRQQVAKGIRVGGGLGTIAALTMLIFGGWSGALMGWLIGPAAALLACYSKGNLSAKLATRLGTRSGVVLGLWIFVATVIEGLVLRPLAGLTSVSWGQILLRGVVGLVITTGVGCLTGNLQGLGNKQRLATLLLIAFILLTFPFADQLAQTAWTAAVIQIQIFLLLALGLNIVVGFAGLLDLGYAAFFAIGAYTTGFLSSPQLGIELNFWIVIWIAALVAAIAGVILGAPTLRLRGDYLAIVTLGFGEIVPVIFRNLTNIQIYEPISKIIASLVGRPELAICLVGCVKPFNLTGGEAGINPIGRPSLPIVGSFQATNNLPWYYLILALLVLAYFLIGRLQNSRLGRAWTAIREDELAASAMGINLVRTKLLAFAMGATFAGLAGAFYAAYISAIFPSVFDFSVSVIVLCMVILGGLGNIVGVILGGIIIMAADRLYLPQLAQVMKGILNTSILPNIANAQWRDFLATNVDPLQMRLLLFGLTLVIMMIVRPEGLIPNFAQQAELHATKNESVVEAGGVMPLLEAQQLTMRFGGLVAVNQVDFTLEPGMIASLIGPNGAGKTTFFNMLTGIYHPTTGYLQLRGRDITGLSPDRLTTLGIARTFQNIRLFNNMTVLDNVLVGRHSRLKAGLVGTLLRPFRVRQEEQQARQRAFYLLEFVGLGTGKAHEIAKNLSYGDQRRLEIARALASDPQILLLDEPTAGMNPNETDELTRFIQRIRDELQLTILLIEHDMKVVMEISDRVSVMESGSKIAEGTPTEVRRDPRVIEAYLGKEEVDG